MAFNSMTDKITLELTLDELKLIDKYVELNDETQNVFDKIKVAYPQPRMTLQQEGEYAVVSFNDKVYYRLYHFQGDVTFSWYIKKGVNVGYPVPTLMMVNDAETERLLEGLYYNHIREKKEKEQRTKKPVEECYKDWWGDYPELETDSQYDDTRWAGFQAGYNAAYEEKVVEEPKDNEWKSVALRFGEKLSDVGPDGYYELSPAAWFRWAVFTYGKEQQVKNAARESVKWCEEHQNESLEDYLTPTVKQKDDYPYKKYTPEETEQSLKQAFREAVKQGVVSSVDKVSDEEDNDKNFKNSLDLIKEWGEKNKPKTLYQICMEWWNEVFVNQMDDDICVDVLVDRIEEFLPKEHYTNSYKFNECIKMIKSKLR